MGMKTITEYMESTFSGEYFPFSETKGVTYIQLKTGIQADVRSGHHALKAARQIAKQMRLDGWMVKLQGDILKISTK